MFRLIASDLDGTLLTTGKQLSSRNADELNRAFRQGTVIVPATGRIFTGLPSFIREAEWFRYCILSNGAEVYDAVEKKTLFSHNMSPEICLKALDFADTLPVLYDIYMDGKGYMPADMYAAFDDYVKDVHYRDLIHRLREPVEDFRSVIRGSETGIQKLQFYFRREDVSLRSSLFPVLREQFPELLATTSVPFNIEINHRDANKGNALEALCRHLGISLEETIAFGDNSNDISMLRKAGLSICMENGSDEAKAESDFVTISNDLSGVATAIRKFI